MSDREPISDLSPAAEVFAQFLAAHDAGEAEDIEQSCRQHPRLAERLRRLHADWVGLDRALGSNKSANDVERYEVLECLAQGGMGTVHRVYDRHLRRELAMKVLRRDHSAHGGHGSSDPRSLSRFLDEARVTGQMQHPGIPPVHDLGIDGDGRLFFTMPLVPGQTLEQIAKLLRQRDPTWPLSRVLGVLLKVCEAVAFAHAQGVIHRDLKPGNVMVGQFGETYVMDWGLARVLAEAETQEHPVVASERAALGVRDPESPLVTRDGDVVGTPAYMPPEQARGERAQIGPRADVYAAGAMLYHVLAGVPPYGGTPESTTAVLARVLAGPPVALERLVPMAPPELVAICARAMATRPEDRYADMRGFAADLRAYLEGRVVGAFETGAFAALKKLVRRNKATALAVASAVVALVAGLIMSLVEAREARASNLLSLAAVDRMLANVGTRRLEDVPRAWPVRQALVEDAIELYATIVARHPGDVSTRARLAKCWRDLGQVRSRLGDFDGAEEALDRAIADFAALAVQCPDRTDFTASRADAMFMLAMVQENRGDVAHAEQGLRNALAMLAGIGQETPPLLELRANFHGQLGYLLAEANRLAEALAEQQEALALARRLVALDDMPVLREGVARRLDQLGLTHVRRKATADAEACHREAVEMLAALHERDPKDERMAASYAVALGNLGLCRQRTSDPGGAANLFRQAAALWREILADHPEVPNYHAGLGTTMANLSRVVTSANEQIACLDEALAAHARALADAPESKPFRARLLSCHRERLMKLCAAKRHRDVVAGAAALAGADPTDAAQAKFAAQFVAYAIGYLADDTTLSAEPRTALEADYAEAVVGHLRTTMARGCRDLEQFEGAHFAPVRDHPGYQAILAELQAK